MTKKGARRKSRELATQGLYQWLVSNASLEEIEGQLHSMLAYEKSDKSFLDSIMHGLFREHTIIEKTLGENLDRPISQLSLVEHAILLIATFELIYHVETPYRVIINEAVEVTKTFGSTDGYKYVNGVLDKLAERLRLDKL
ncbi:MAG: transcription antitermination factor NusB [Burkholderia sp.]|nr:transcription antitermination factor NusB [Burkholderia sp.]